MHKQCLTYICDNEARPAKPLERGKYQKVMAQYDNLNSTMESRDHSKNRASLKKHMIRGNLFSKTILFFVGVFFISSLWGQKLEYDFGEIQKDKEVSTIFQFKNNTESDITITRIITSTGSIKAQALEENIKSGETIKIKIICNFNYFSFGNFNKSLMIYTNTETKYQVILKGKIIEVGEPREIGQYSEGFIIVELGDKRGFKDKNGKLITPIKYEDAKPFKEGVAQVRLNMEYGLIDKTGKEVTPCKYNEIYYFLDEVAVVMVHKYGSRPLYGIIDKYGKEIIPCKYHNIERPTNGIIRAQIVCGIDTEIDKKYKDFEKYDNNYSVYYRIFLDMQGNEYKSNDEVLKVINKK